MAKNIGHELETTTSCFGRIADFNMHTYIYMYVYTPQTTISTCYGHPQVDKQVFGSDPKP